MKKVVSNVLTLVIMFSVVLACWPNSAKAENLLLNFVVMSDPHIGGNSSTHPRVLNLVDGLKDAATYLPNVSAILIAGDLTENGYEDQYKGLSYALDFSPTSNLLLTMGNHDAGRDQGGNFEEAYNMYLKYCGEYLQGTDPSVPYYARWIKGYHFIVLCTEGAEWDGAYISDTQLAWFEKKLAEGAEDGKPIFVMCHQALNYTHPRTENPENQIGPASDKIKAIIEKYPQVIYMSGHTHNGFGYSPVISNGAGTFIDVPPMRGTTAYGYKSSGVLWYVHVYKDYVIFSARDYTSQKWLPEYDIKIYTADIMPTTSPTPPVNTPRPAPEPEFDAYELLEETRYSVNDTYITGISDRTKVEIFLEAFKNKDDLTVYDANDEELGPNAFVGTGCRVQFRSGTEEASERRVIMKGDIDGNGRITSGDYLAIKFYFQGKYQLAGDSALAADTDSSGRIDSRDYLRIRYYFAGRYDLY